MNLLPYIDILANLIISNHFHDSNCLLILTDNQNSFDYHAHLPTLRFSITNHRIPDEIFHYFGCQHIIIKSNEPLTLFVSFEREIRQNDDRFNNRKYLILPGEKMVESFTDIETMDEINYISDLLLLTDDGADKNVIYLKTHRYTGQQGNKLYVIDEWFTGNESFLYGSNLFPNKLSNQQGRQIRLATFTYEPYTILNDTENSFLGSEMLCALEFLRYLNASPLMVVNENDYWGEIYPNWTGLGLLGNLVEDKADIGFAALYTWEDDYKYIDLSKPLVRTGITCLVPAPKLAGGWTTPLFSYSDKMWIVVAFTAIFCIFTLFLLNSYYFRAIISSKRNYISILGNAIFTIIKLLILQNLTKNERPQTRLVQYLMGLVFIFSLFLTSTYSSGLSSIMTVPRYDNPIDTLDAFASSDILWGATQDAWVFSMQSAQEEIPEFTGIIKRFVAASEGDLRGLSIRGDFAFSLERLPNDNYAIGTYIKKDAIAKYHLMKEDLYWEQTVYMLRKSSILLPLVDLFILRVFEAGLISFWQNEAVALYMDTSVQRIVNYYAHHSQEKLVVKLEWIHVEGAFGILIFGYVVSGLAFMVEVVRGRVRNKSV